MPHRNGPGLRVLDRRPWYGVGCCSLCGESETDRRLTSSPLVGCAVRFWSPDDGWTVGVLCEACGEETRARGPRPTDYASHDEPGGITQEERRRAIDLDASVSGGDLDHMVTDW